MDCLLGVLSDWSRVRPERKALKARKSVLRRCAPQGMYVDVGIARNFARSQPVVPYQGKSDSGLAFAELGDRQRRKLRWEWYSIHLGQVI